MAYIVLDLENDTQLVTDNQTKSCSCCSQQAHSEDLQKLGKQEVCRECLQKAADNYRTSLQLTVY
jgi:uncharacterized paraquat-inducible protein A